MPDVLGIVTADRPRQLAACLSSFISHCRRFGRSIDIIVVDGSRMAQHRQMNSAIAQRLTLQEGIKVSMFGSSASASAMALLGLSKAECEVLGLAPGPTGSNRNLLLLLAAGAPVLMCDDDIIFKTWQLPDAHLGPMFAGHAETRTVEFMNSRIESLDSPSSAIEPDLMLAHRALLGKPLYQISDQLEPPVDRRLACVHMVRSIKDRSGVVRMTFSGIAGDSGASRTRLLCASGTTRDSLLATPESYERSRRSREIRRIARVPTVTHSRECMAGCMALDNSVLPPVFMPTGRNQDGIFGSLMYVIDLSAYSGHVPVGVLHDSNRTTYALAESKPSPTAASSQIARVLIESLGSQIVATDVSGRLVQLASRFLEISVLSRTDVEEILCYALRYVFQTDLQAAESSFATVQGKNAIWQRDLEDYMRALRKRMDSPASYLPAEWTSDGILDLRLTHRYFRSFGRLLEAWPALWALAAREKFIVSLT